MLRPTLWCLLVATTAFAAAAPVTYRIQTIAGSDRLGDNGPAVAAQFGSIQGVVSDRNGNLYLSDTDHHRIRRVSAAGIVTTIAGTGTGGFSGDDGPALDAQLNLPYGLALDAAGYLYIADLGNQRVRRISPQGTIITLAGDGHKGSLGDEGPALDAQLMSPRNLAVDASGNLYISEFEGHRVRRVAADGRISTVAGTGIAGFSGDGFPARFAQLGFPAGIALDRFGALYVCDSQNQRVRKIVPGGGIVTVLGGAPGTSLLTPTAIAVDGYGTIFVGDRSASVRQYSLLNAWTTAAGTGLIGFEGDNGLAPAARLTRVQDLAVDSAGSLLIADGSRLRRVSTHGVITTVAGDGYLRFVGDGGPPADAILLQPTAIALDSAGGLFIADSGMHRVRHIVPASGAVSTVAGTSTSGFDAAQLVASQTLLDTPSGLALDINRDLLIADTANQRIRRVGADGRIRTVAGTGEAGNGAQDVAADHAVLRAPRGICTDRAGNSYVADSGNHRLLRLPLVGLVANAAGNGAPGDGGDGGPAPLAQVNLPWACAVDAAGSLYIADSANHRIRKVTSGGVMSTVAGTGVAGLSGDGAAAERARLNTPKGVAVDTEGALYIADTGNHAIRKVTTDGLIRTLAGSGMPGFAGDDGAAADSLLNGPQGVAVDPMGVIYVADTGNARVRRLVPETAAPAALELPPHIDVTSAAGGAPSPVAPGQLVRILGSGLGPENGVTAVVDTSGLLPTLLAGAEVLFDGQPAPVLYVQAVEVVAQVPYAVYGQVATSVEVRYQRASRGQASVPVLDAAPALFPATLNSDGSLNSSANPAPRASVVTLFATGEGLTRGPNISGRPAENPYPEPRLPVSVRIGGLEADLLYAAAAPGLVGLLQIDVRVPSGFVPPGQAPVVLAIGPFLAPAFSLWLK